MVQGTDAPTGKRGDTTNKNSNTSVGSATHVDICAAVSGVVKPFFRRGRGCRTSLSDMVDDLLCCPSCKWNPTPNLQNIPCFNTNNCGRKSMAGIRNFGCFVLVMTLLPADGDRPKRNRANVTLMCKRSMVSR
jgi:hypothetical protein